jgi:Raf kinase inhibitor-like YbhB/YbcL family protein
MTLTRSTLGLLLGVLVAFAAPGCSSGGGDGSGSGGTTSTGGTTGSGGTTGTGGTTGSGGATGSGGTTGTGGAAGTTGVAGTTGAAGKTGAAGTTGAAGAGGRGGTTGAAGSGGRGGSSGAAGSTGGGGQGALTMTLTSPAFTEGMSVPINNTCAGTNISPELHWTPGPSTTQSYAMVLTDLTNNLVHWSMWNIKADVTSLAAMLPSDATLTTAPIGAMQASFMTSSHGYTGPCPSGSLHTYQFQVYALSVATVANLTTSSTPTTAKTQIVANALASGTLSGTSNASKP